MRCSLGRIRFWLAGVILMFLVLQFEHVWFPLDKTSNTTKIHLDPETQATTLYGNAIQRHQLPDIVTKTLFKALQRSKKNNNKLKIDLTIGDSLDYYRKQIINGTPEDLAPWKLFVNNIRQHQFQSTGSHLLEVVNAMKYLPISSLKEKPQSGTEYKFYFTLADGTPVLAKPMRLPVGVDAPPLMSKNDFYERFQSEVVSFHLSRLFRFSFVPPVVSRYVNLTSEIRKLVSESKINDTFFIDTDGATCFIGNCPKKCDDRHAICGQPDVLAVSFALLIPDHLMNGWIDNPIHPLSLYRIKNDNYCVAVRERLAATTNATRSYLDIIDINIFDYIQGNLDRHHYGKITKFGENSHVILFDNGRGFARAYQDEFDLLFPLSKCCQVRQSTMEKLLMVYNTTDGLSGSLRKSLQTEIVQPILTESHLEALDRRLVKVLEVIYSCVGMNGKDVNNTIIDDGF